MSLFVSFTLTPMLCCRFLKLEPGEAGHAKSKSGFVYRIDRLALRPGAAVRAAVHASWSWCCLHRASSSAPVPIGQIDGRRPGPARRPERVRGHDHHARGLHPRADRPASSPRSRTGWRKLPGVIASLHHDRRDQRRRPARGRATSRAGSIYVRMNDLDDRDYTQFDGHAAGPRDPARTTPTCARQRQRRLGVPGAGRTAADVPGQPAGPRPRTARRATPTQLIAELQKMPGLVDVDTTLSLRKPEVQVIVDRERGQRPGHPGAARSPTRCSVLVGGMPVSKFTRRRPSSTTSGSAPTSRIARDPQTLVPADASPRRRSGLVKLSQPGQAGRRSAGPSQIERLDRAADRHRPGATPRASRWARPSARAETILKDMNLPPQYAYIFTGQAKTLGETGYYFLIAFGLSHPVHVPDPGRPVRELDAPDRDPDGPAGDDPVRPAVAGAVPHADGPVRDVRPVHAGRHRQEERHPAGRHDQRAARARACRATRRSSRPTTRGCGRS